VIEVNLGDEPPALVAFDPGHDVVPPHGTGFLGPDTGQSAENALEARICRVAVDSDAAAVPTARIVANCGVAPNRSFIADRVSGADDTFAKAAVQTSMARSCR
jgi:hypothetical protein